MARVVATSRAGSTEFQRNKSIGFRRPEAGTVGPASRPQDNSQQKPLRILVPDCKTCGKKHPGECRKAGITCYRCNQKGHYANECPKPQPKISCLKCRKVGHMAKDCRSAPTTTNKVLRIGAGNAATQPRARTFNMTMKDAVKDADVVAGTLPVNSVNAKVLIDSGATKSFISHDFALKLHCDIELLKEAMIVKIAN